MWNYSCVSKKNKEVKEEVVTIEVLMASPDTYIGKEVTLQGLCTHICKHSGQKLILDGSVLVFTGDDMYFGTELENAVIKLKGTLAAIEKMECKGEHDAEIEEEFEADEEIVAEEEVAEEGHKCAADVPEIKYQLNCVSIPEIITPAPIEEDMDVEVEEEVEEEIIEE